MVAVTAIFFSCRRLDLLRRTVEAFEQSNTYPIFETIIVNDSGDQAIHEQLRAMYPHYTLVLHPSNVGLMRSIDIGYSHIKTEYFYHSEDDWCCTGRGGFIEESLRIMLRGPMIEEVWLNHYNNHPLRPGHCDGYRLTAEWDGWFGFTTACGLKRLSDYHRVGPYCDIERGETIWHHERNIGRRYHELGYTSAVLDQHYVENIGIRQSEYITGKEI